MYARLNALALALATLWAPASALGEITLPQPTPLAGPAFAGGQADPAVVQAYIGPATPEKLAAALDGLRLLITELSLITPPNPCWYCTTGAINRWVNSPLLILDYPSSNTPIAWLGTPTLLTAASDSDLGDPGAAVVLAFARLQLTDSFETDRAFIIGHPAYAPGYHPSYLFAYLEGTEPPPAGGPGWIDTNGHDLRISGVLTSHQTLYKEGGGTLWLTGANVWHAVPVVQAGVLQGDTTSLATDIVNSGWVSFAQAADGRYEHVVSGVGGVDKIGAGVLALTRTQTYTGPTRILEGTLALAGGQIESSAAVEVAAGAVLDARHAASTILKNLSGAGLIRFGDGWLTLRNDADTAFAGQIDGQGELVVTGSKTLALTGTNTHRGGTRITSGHLAIAADASLGAEGAALTLENGGRLSLLADVQTARPLRAGHGGSVLDTADHDLTLLSPLAGHGQMLTKQGSGTLSLHAAASYAGAVTVAEGALALAGAGALNPATEVHIGFGVLDIANANGNRRLRSVTGAVSAEIRLGGNDLILSGGTSSFDGLISGQGGLTLDGAFTSLTLTGANTYTGPTTLMAGSLRARPQSLSDRIINHGRLELFDYGGLNDISAYSGDITGSGQLIKADKSVIWLRGRNDFSGGTRIDAGVLMGNTDSLPGDIETHAGLAFYQVADGLYAGRISGTGTLMSFGPGALTLAGSNTHTGGTALSNTLRIASDANLGGPASKLLFVGGTLEALDDLTLDRHIVLGQAGGRIDSNGHNLRLDGVIEGPGGLSKQGAGVLYLTGELGYTGTTVVTDGMLVADAAFAGDVQVLDGAWLQAKGRVAGDLTVATGAGLSAGNSPGLLEVGGDFVARGEILVEIAGPSLYDRILVGGVADLADATLNLVLLPGAVADEAQNLPFLTAAGGILGLDRVTYVHSRGLDAYRVVLADDTLYLAPVPEPEAWAMLLAGLGLVGLMARRRRFG